MANLFDLSSVTSIEDFKKAIPSRVFFNHFSAINYHIFNNSDRYDLKKIAFYNQIKIKNSKLIIDDCRKLLWNAWSTEVAFNMSSKVETDDFFKFALHWHFPQAYYSIYLAMTAFHETQGIANDNHEKSIKIFGNSVKDGHFPDAISFYANGLYKDFKYSGLTLDSKFDKDFNGLKKIDTLKKAEGQIGVFLKSTRKENAENKRKRGEKEHSKRSEFQNRNGNLVKSFQKKHWDIIYRTIPEITLLNILYRLRLKANYRDIETFMNADIDFREFHKCLGEIVFYLNFIHEAYLHKAIGDIKYKKIVHGFKGEYHQDRYENLISKI
ncbi:hypothetical protein Q4534_01630 [Cyclobacterium sp. 1_MG-2023]|uniref:hypothetical protein n=1 Tax=Cyclobacterium sp. 1_MG-2023 TaxID=3062681 RepID=UPI0026E1405E|nr:hypothetical protein [Cyclobacterium sp. 1_MG-2023]MDO6436082.1 hypothetical protein [Cyclobacterium sp. 1_MG-2023]